MAKQAINIGTTANDGTGDPIRDAFDKVNDNEDELYEGANITETSPLTKTSVSATSVTLSIEDDGTTVLTSTVGVHTIRWYFNDSDSSMVIKRSAANTDILIDNISCKILQGNPGKLT